MSGEVRKPKLAWSYAKGEFIIVDHYYFSILKRLVTQRYDWKLPRSFKEIEQFDPDVIIFNYPEIRFTDNEVEKILEFLHQGKGVGMFSYYLNEDEVSSNLNRVLNRLGLGVNFDEVRDPNSCYNSDDLLLVTDNLHESLRKRGVNQVMLACTSSLNIDSESIPLVYDRSGKHVLFAYRKVGSGRLIVGGTCVFWDNFSIEKYDNEAFSMAILDILEKGL